MTSRLASNYPDIQRLLQSLDTQERRSLATRIVLWAAQEAGIDPDEMRMLLARNQPEPFEALCAEHEECYFELARRSDDRHSAFFAKARAYSAAAFLVRGAWDEAVYESTFATEKALLIDDFS
ncbi:hypothetical protein ASF84_14495 [Pseudomonas sp. Leaf127]|uniref:hypothetical protein n=1 Tax=Pseudomonas sp. Leaf127 TaxID=1736267 RepID=UPI0007024462|nr:hypothetical protein [Pseudomonas sp. Leaf127]KQQ54542.1 hypothetical protein ASF84_14495 [Pseudomonas sp. Leaf127]